MLVFMQIIVIYHFIIYNSLSFGEISVAYISCIRDIAIRYFIQDGTLVISTDDDNHIEVDEIRELHHIVKEFHNLFIWPIQLFSQEQNEHERYPRHQHGSYILLYQTSDLLKIKQRLLQLRKSYAWNPRAKFLLVFLNEWIDEYELQECVKQVFSVLWNLNAIDVCALVSFSESTAMNKYRSTYVFYVYTWFPYDLRNRLTEYDQIRQIKRWKLNTKIDSLLFFYNTSIYPQKIPDNFDGYPIRVSTFEYEPFIMFPQTTKNNIITYGDGLEIRLLNVIVKMLNVSSVFLSPPSMEDLWGNLLGNGSWTGAIGEILRKESDIVICGCYYPCHMSDDLECSSVYTYDEERWYVPCARPIPSWINIFLVFDKWLWVLFILVYLLASLVVWNLIKLAKRHQSTRNTTGYTILSYCLLNMWAVILGVATPQKLPENVQIRCVFFLWIVYCLAINTVYQTFLVSFMVNPNLEKQISTVNEILNSGLHYAISATVQYLLPELSSERFQKRELCYDPEHCRYRLAHTRDFALLYSQINTDYVVALNYLNSNGKPLFCTIKETFVRQYITMAMKKGNPILYKINSIILRILQAGLVELWWKDLKYRAALTAAKHTDDAADYHSLTLHHFQSAFYLLLIGNTIAILIYFTKYLFQKSYLKKLNLCK
ncbi:Ionotropic receptor 209 [Blattella germanica]|nr:Ionotropic receptor 209 [Blattella germanica]